MPRIHTTYPFLSRLLSASFLAVLAFGLTACGPSLPEPSSEAYRETVSAFYTGLAAMQVGEDQRAEENLRRAAEQAPGEPAVWTNLGLLALRRSDFEAAGDALARARSLAPDDSRILLLSGVLEGLREQPEQAVAYLREAIAADSTGARALYALLQEVERQDGGEAEIRGLLDRLQALQPENLAVLLERARFAARQGDAAMLRQTVDRLEGPAGGWPDDVRAQWVAVRGAAADPPQAAAPLAFLHNLLLSLPAYRADLAALAVPVELVGEPVQRFLRLPAPRPSPAPPDDALAFSPAALMPGDTMAWTWTGIVSLTGEGIPSVLVADGRTVRLVGGEDLAFPGCTASTPPSLNGVAALDYDYDFQMDLALAGAGGFRLFRQDSTAAAFTDVTSQTTLPASVIGAAYAGAWPADIDLEGDVDLVLATPDGPPRVLRNNGDGTFTPVSLFDGVTALRDLVWADLDADGDPDAALLDADGGLRVFTNDRQGRFRPRTPPPDLAAVRALSAADLDSDGVIDLALLRDDGALLRLSDRNGAWTLDDLTRWDAPPEAALRLFVADLDNNGGLDLIVTAPGVTQAWLHDGQGGYLPLADTHPLQTFALGPLQDPGRLDLVGLDDAGRPMQFVNQGTKPYHWKQVRPRAATAIGDQRINSFGIGGEVELRAGLLFQKQPITRPFVHFGLGENLTGDVVRIIWPNGAVQAEFDLLSDEVVKAQQRLKGSCPWVFTYDGTQMRFVTDFLWRSPLGLRINAQETAGVMTTEDWVKIDGDALVPREGLYDVRITAELWETHFFDHVSLMVVDHPAETDVFVDERFAFPPPELAVHPTTPPRPVAAAVDDREQDVTDLVRTLDARYLDTFTRGPYQGVARDHYVEVDLGDDVPAEGPLWLLASGWIRPTDSSINVALSHGAQAPPRGLRLEVPDGAGGWTVAHENLGFPAGKTKTILIDLHGVFRPDGPRRVRMHTNLEIYWDALAWASGLPEAELAVQRLDPQTADLRYRGFSAVHEADRSSPELPDYETLAGTTPRWRDLVGYHTRFGDVRPLLRTVDDRYVIMNAGDELALRFAAPPPPPDGWRRDFVLVGDGWVKDGDYNTTFSTTVRPLPSHDQPAYDTPPGRLQDDPVYRRHPEDWQTYHTRYVTPNRFHDALQPR